MNNMQSAVLEALQEGVRVRAVSPGLRVAQPGRSLRLSPSTPSGPMAAWGFGGGEESDFSYLASHTLPAHEISPLFWTCPVHHLDISL